MLKHESSNSELKVQNVNYQGIFNSGAKDYSIFEISKIWSENHRVAPQAHSILSLGTSFKEEAQHFAVLPFFWFDPE